MANSKLVHRRRLQCHTFDAWHGRQLQRKLLALLHSRRLLPTLLLRRGAGCSRLQGLLVALNLGRLPHLCQQLPVLVCGLPATLKLRICPDCCLLRQAVEWARLVSWHLLQSLCLMLLRKERAGASQLGPQRVAQLHQALVLVSEPRNLRPSLLQLLYSNLLGACLLLLLLAVCIVLQVASRPLSAHMLPRQTLCCNSALLLMLWRLCCVCRPCRLQPGSLLLLLMVLLVQHLHLSSHSCQRAAQTGVLLPLLSQGSLHSTSAVRQCSESQGLPASETQRLCVNLRSPLSSCIGIAAPC